MARLMNIEGRPDWTEQVKAPPGGEGVCLLPELNPNQSHRQQSTKAERRSRRRRPVVYSVSPALCCKAVCWEAGVTEPERETGECMCVCLSGGHVCKGVGLVTRGAVCRLSSSRCSNIFFFVMMPNTILKTNSRYIEDVTTRTKEERKTRTCSAKTNKQIKTGATKNIRWVDDNM